MTSAVEDGSEPLPAADVDGGEPLRMVETLVSDARAFIDAEIAFQKARASFAAGKIKLALICAGLALLLLGLAIMALVMGLILALTPLITAWGAMAVVTLLLLALAGVLVWVAVRAGKAVGAQFASEPVADKGGDADG